jgi:hypothetical protein
MSKPFISVKFSVCKKGINKGYVSIKLKILVKCHKDNDIQCDDIDLFLTASTGRDRNDVNNKKREKILQLLPHIYDKNYSFADDDRWKTVQSKFMETMKNIINIEFDALEMNQKAGRGHNFDFQADYYKNNNVVFSIAELEFKNGSDTVTARVPQHLSLQTNSQYGIFASKTLHYHEYFYYETLPKLVSLYKKHNIDLPTVPSFEEYMKLVKNTNQNCHEFFKALRNNEDKLLNEKSCLVDESINDYLLNVSEETIDFELIQQKLLESQGNKTYLLWNGKNFTIDHIHKDELILNRKVEMKKNKKDLISTIVFHTKHPNKSWEFLLRWRNHKGILNPAWQIKLRCFK